MMSGNGTAQSKVEVQFQREEVLELQLLEERIAKMRLQMQMIQNQAQQIHMEMEKAEREKQDFVASLSMKYEVDVSKFAIDLETNKASGMTEAAPA